jgi:hypothetical protein
VFNTINAARVSREEGAPHQAALVFLVENWGDAALGSEIPAFTNVRIISPFTGLFCSLKLENFTSAPNGTAQALW